MTKEPLTLRQLAGLSSTPADLKDSVIIIVDAQKEYTEGRLPLFEIEKSIDTLAQFLDRARAMQVPIVHIVQIGKAGGKVFNSETHLVEIIDEVKPIDGEAVIEKHLPSSFKGTTLEEKLTELGKKDLIITGYMTHMCVNSTTRDAAELGYRCTVIEELTTTRDLPDGKGGTISAATVKSANLAALADRFAIVIEKAEDLR